MSNLAIRGHATRGKEVIEILEMLGGQTDWCTGTLSHCAYFINKANRIDYTDTITDEACFTLEEFLENFPYKVGDKVKVKETGKDVTIDGMSWRNGCEVIYDTCYNNDCVSFYSAEELQPYKEEIMEKVNKAVFDANAQCCDIMNHLVKEETMEEIIKIDIPKGYEFAGVDDDKQQVVFTKIQPQYPKTYEECYDVLGRSFLDDYIEGHKWELIMNFQKLLVCRDAYRKIAGEQMGLGKPWEPDWDDKSEDKYTIVVHDNQHCYANCKGACSFLTFPTAEMRDAFYENFKDLINQCKELL